MRASKGTPAAQTALLVNDELGTVVWDGYDGSSMSSGATFAASCGSNWSGSNRHSRIVLATCGSGSIALTNRVWVENGLTVLTGAGAFPTGGDRGAGTINVAGDYYQNGVALSATYLPLAGGTTTGSVHLADQSSVRAAVSQVNFHFISTARDWNMGVLSDGRWFVLDQTGGNFRIAVNPTTGVCENTTGTWTAFSDIALKDDVLDYAAGLTEILQLRPVTFRWKDKKSGDQLNHGLIAQEVEKVLPEFVGETDMAFGDEASRIVKTLDPGKLVYVCINAIKDLHKRIEALEARLDALDGAR